MSGTAKALLAATILAFILSALRFFPSIGLSTDLADFAGGLGVGLLISLVVMLGAERTPRD
jgi:hypothetical protein